MDGSPITPRGERRPSDGRAAFTLLELMVVVGIISMLMAILVPALRQVTFEADKVVCSSHMNQWGTALVAHANDNEGYYPDNRDHSPPPLGNPNLDRPGFHVSWNSSDVALFWEAYLVKNSQASKTDEDDVLNCPTQRWHQINDISLAGNLVGYFYLPFRTPTNINYSWAENGNGRSWVAKNRMYGPKANAPILMDMQQESKANGWWHTDEVTPYSSHIRDDGTPRGGNFLFEDVHVEWHRREDVGLGADMGGWNLYYDIPLR